MEKIGKIAKDRINIVLEGFDPISSGGFTQVPNVVLKNKNLSLGAKFCYSMLLMYAWQNDFCFPGQEKLAEEIGITPRSVRNHLAELRKIGYISVKRRGLTKTNVYILHAKIKADRK